MRPAYSGSPSCLLIMLLLFALQPFGCTPAQRFRTPTGGMAGAELQHKVRAAAQEWLGTPYLLGGNDHSGIDCSGLACNIYRRAFNMQLPRQTRLQRKEGYSVPLSRLKPGDLLFFRFRGSGGINHVGVYLGDGQFIHASSTRGVVISSLKDRYYRRHLIVARRYYH